MHARAHRGVALGDLDDRGFVQGQRVGIDSAVVDRLADRTRLADHLTHMHRRDLAGAERRPQHGEVRDKTRIGERVLHRALRDVSGSGVLADHGPLDGVSVHRSHRHLFVPQQSALGEKRHGLGLQDGDLTLLRDPGIEQRGALCDEVGELLGHASSIEQRYWVSA